MDREGKTREGAGQRGGACEVAISVPLQLQHSCTRNPLFPGVYLQLSLSGKRCETKVPHNWPQQRPSTSATICITARKERGRRSAFRFRNTCYVSGIPRLLHAKCMNHHNSIHLMYLNGVLLQRARLFPSHPIRQRPHVAAVPSRNGTPAARPVRKA